MLLDLTEPSKANLKIPLCVAGVFGFISGFLLAYQQFIHSEYLLPYSVVQG